MSATQTTLKGETMATTNEKTASEVVQEQHAAILHAIQLLQNDLNEMTSKISPTTESWRDVVEYAHVAEMARGIIERYEEQ
jgi:hypothetical protein